MDNFYVDEPVLVSFFVSELGWMLQYGQSRLRYVAKNEYPDHKVLIMMNRQFHPVVADFTNWTLDLPQWFYDLGLETDCYEAPLPGSPPGSLTPPGVYANLLKYFRQHYNRNKAIELFPPRGCNLYLSHLPQTFTAYGSDCKIETDRPIISVFPRARARAANRNVPEYIWKSVVDDLKNEFLVVIGGTPSGSCLSGYSDKNVINLVDYNGDDKFEKVMEYCCNSVCSISSQSGLTHVSLLCKTPSYIIGHEKERHAIELNRFKSPTSFRYVSDYRAIDSQTILRDVAEFLSRLKAANYFDKRDKTNIVGDTVPFDSVIMEDLNNLKQIVSERNSK